MKKVFVWMVTCVLATIGAVFAWGCDVNGINTNCNNEAVAAVSTTGAGGAQPSIIGCGGMGGTGGICPAGGGGSAGICDCPWPINFDPECHTLRLHTNSGCVSEVTANGLPCRGGVGVCFGGVCNAPNAPGQCQQSPADPPWVVCFNVGDCDDNNKWTMDSCPSPGCESCLHVPVQDGTICDPGMVTVQGACCDVGP